jgi:hypothetical protein
MAKATRAGDAPLAASHGAPPFASSGALLASPVCVSPSGKRHILFQKRRWPDIGILGLEKNSLAGMGSWQGDGPGF